VIVIVHGVEIVRGVVPFHGMVVMVILPDLRDLQVGGGGGGGGVLVLCVCPLGFVLVEWMGCCFGRLGFGDREFGIGELEIRVGKERTYLTGLLSGIPV